MKDREKDSGCVNLRIDREAYLSFISAQSGNRARPVHKWRWRDLHALYTVTEPYICGPNTGCAPVDSFPEQAFGP